MIDLILIIIFCYQIYRMTSERGISPVSYILNYITAIILMVMAIMFAFIHFYGIEAIHTEQGIKDAMKFIPISISCEVFLFLYLRRRIQKTPLYNEDNNTRPTPPEEKKDFSYFR